MTQKALSLVLGLLIGIGIVAAWLYVAFLREKVWNASNEPPSAPQPIQTQPKSAIPDE